MWYGLTFSTEDFFSAVQCCVALLIYKHKAYTHTMWERGTKEKETKTYALRAMHWIYCGMGSGMRILLRKKTEQIQNRPTRSETCDWLSNRVTERRAWDGRGGRQAARHEAGERKGKSEREMRVCSWMWAMSVSWLVPQAPFNRGCSTYRPSVHARALAPRASTPPHKLPVIVYRSFIIQKSRILIKTSTFL